MFTFNSTRKTILLNYLKVLFRDATQIGGSHASKGPEIVVDGIEIYWGDIIGNADDAETYLFKGFVEESDTMVHLEKTKIDSEGVYSGIGDIIKVDKAMLFTL